MFEGGAYLGTKELVPLDDSWYDLAAANLGKFNVEALIIIGGFQVRIRTRELQFLYQFMGLFISKNVLV